LKAVSATSS
jgi:hypothetical protein